MKTLFEIFLLQRHRQNTRAAIAVTAHPLVFKYGKLLRKALTSWSSGVLWHNAGLAIADIPTNEIPITCQTKGKVLLHGNKRWSKEVEDII
jgi:hypothetical protein